MGGRFELSKYLSASQIPVEDMPWLGKSIDGFIKIEMDPRTRNFLVLAAGILQGEKSLELISLALQDRPGDILFGAVSSLAKFKTISQNFSWDRVLQIAEGKVFTDEALQHTAHSSFNSSWTKMKLFLFCNQSFASRIKKS
jgi:hypothetical protein